MMTARLKTPMKPSLKAGAAGAAALTVAAIGATPLIMQLEGRRLDPYHDIVKVQTVCDGATKVPMRRYSNAECDAITQRLITGTYGPEVLRCTPGLASRPAPFYELQAAISFAYNVGSAAYCRSTPARRFNAGDWRGGCQAMVRWNMAGGRVVQGLINRRRIEIAHCMKGAVL